MKKGLLKISSKAKVSSKKNEDEMKKRMNSLRDVAGEGDFSGSAYNSKGRPDQSKRTSNKKRR